MSRFGIRGGWGVIVLVLACGAGIHQGLRAQGPPATAGVEVAPVKCWWKADKDAVLIGERFALTVTCAVFEGTPTKAVLDPKQFDPTALSLMPFEVLGSTPHNDVVSAPWRYLQHDYTLRLLDDASFGKDVDIPELRLTYGIQSAETGESEGLDQTVVFPALPIRILSLVPADATGIREVSNDAFGDVESRQFLARGSFILGGILFGFAAVFVGLAGKQVAGRYRALAPALGRPVSPAAVIRGLRREIDTLRTEAARDGWSQELADRGLSVFRIAAALALQRPVAQTAVDPDAQAQSQTGQLVVRSGLLGRRRRVVSASITPAAIARRLALAKAPEPRLQGALEELRETLRTFGAAQYGRAAQFDRIELDAALEQGLSALRRLPDGAVWPVRKAEAIAKSLSARGAEWSR